MDLIDAIGTVTLESEEAIKDARTAYDSLTDAQKGLVTNYKVLTDAEAALKQLKDDKAAADAVIEMIDSIGEVTADDEQLIKDARAAYDALTDAQIKLVTNYEKLTAAEKAIAFLLATDEDKAAADAVEKMIEDIGTVTLDKADEITAARKAYIALTDLQKKLVENLDTLVAAENVLETLKAASAEDAYKSTGKYLKDLAEKYGLVVGSTGGEWIVIGLERAGISIPDVEAYYKEVVKFVRAEINDKEQLHRSKSTENSRIILALTALGYDVTDVDGHNLLVGLNDMTYLKKQGINVKTGCAVSAIRTEAEGKIVEYIEKETTKQEACDLVLMAVGRGANLSSLNLDDIGIAYTPKGITVNENMQTSLPHIYAVGDINGLCQLAHAATFQSYRALNHILGKEDSIDFGIIPAAVFTTPEVATVGLSEEAAEAQGITYSTHKAFYRANGKALAMGADEGLAKFLTDADGKIIGCHILGEHAADLIHEAATLMKSGATLHTLADSIHAHPSLSEILLSAAE